MSTITQRDATGRWWRGIALLLACLLGGASPALGELIEDREQNYVLEIPPGWSKLPAAEGWEKLAIVAGAVRQLEELKDGNAAKGEGGQVHLAITDAPEGKTLDDLAADDEVRGFLMNRFGTSPGQWPSVDVVADKYEDGLEIRLLRSEGKAPNLKGRKGPTRAVMLLTIAKKRFYKLRMYAWHSEFDAEGLKDDLDLIEMNFYIPDTKEEDTEGEGPRPPDEMEGEDAPQGDEGEEKVFADEKVGWRLVKPVGIKSSDWDKEKYADAVAWFEDNDHVGSYQIIFYVIPRGRRNDRNQQIPDINLKDWALDQWWERFTPDHPDGAIVTYKWPRKTKFFLTMPDLEEEKVVASTPKRRPKEADGSDLIKKLRAVEKVKNKKLGEEKTIEAYRGVLAGSRPRVGKEIVIRFVWGTARLTCMISISMTRDAPMKWTDKIRALLESVEMTGRPR